MPELVGLGSCFGARLPLGLATICLTQGTQSLLGPLLEASDDAAGAILAQAYGLVGQGCTPAAALREAQLAYLKQNRDAPPRLWAVLVALGR